MPQDDFQSENPKPDAAVDSAAEESARKRELAREKAGRLAMKRWQERDQGVTFTTSGRAIRSQLIFLAVVAAFLLILHIPLLTLPFHWDELGQFIPSALDLYRDGAWITHTAQPNIHPPGLTVILAGLWMVFGYSIIGTRIAMLLIAAVGVWLSFLLAIRLARGTAGAPAFAAVALLMMAPMFYTQSMMALLDMPAMTFTILALLLFLDEKYVWCAAACTALVLIKETAITTPMVFGAWLLFKDRKVRQALYFFAPAVAFGIWLVVLHQATGSWFGNKDFGQFNVNESLSLQHLGYAMVRRIYTLFFADGHWIGSVALYVGWRELRGKPWTLALWVAGAQLVLVTVLGGAVLNRYLLPILPIFYIMIAVAASVYPSQWRITSHTAMITLLLIGWFVNPPFPFPLEDNLAVVDFVHVQRDTAQFLESFVEDRTIATVWPLTVAMEEPAYGYVSRRLHVVAADGQHAEQFVKLGLDNPLQRVDIIVIYSRGGYPPQMLLDVDGWRHVIERFNDLHPTATSEELAELGFRKQQRFARGSQWSEVYLRRRF